MTYNKQGKKQKINKSNNENENVVLLGRTRKQKPMNQAKFVTKGIYSNNYKISINQWTLAIDVGKKNLGYALYNGNVFKFDLFNIQEQIENNFKRNEGDMPSKRVKVLLKWFKNLINKYNIVELVVEKQVKLNGIAMQIENVLLTLACENNIHFKIYDPKNKFQYIPIEFRSEKKEHKKISIHYAWNILYNYGLNMNHFMNFKKKDDISDSICMALMSRETDENLIRYMITDHTDNDLLKDLTKCIKFKKLLNH